MKKDNKILAGYKQKGKIFIPPIKQISGNIIYTKYVHDILPEIIWIGLINDMYGYKRGIDIVKKTAEMANEIEKHPIVDFSFVSDFNKLNTEKKAALKQKMSDKSLLIPLQEALLPLTKLYTSFPMSFFKKKSSVDKKPLIKKIKICLEKHFDTYQQPSLIAQSCVYYISATNDRIQMASHIEPPCLDAIINDIESDAAQKAAGKVRIFNRLQINRNIIMGDNNDSEENKWAKSFWNQSYKIDSCNFSYE